MDAETKHYLDECARLGALARERKASADAQARAASITIEQLRARIAKLEAALRAAIGDVELSAASARARATYEHVTANTRLAEELESHAAIYRAALKGE